MNLYFRFLLLAIKRLFHRPPQGPLDLCITPFRVVPSDLDVNLHMNNGIYLSLMDLGRTDLMIRAGFFWKLFPQGYYPVVVSEGIRFKKSLELFQTFELRTRLNSWTDKDFYIQQDFYRGEEFIARGVVKARFLQKGRKGTVPPAEIFRVAQVEVPDQAPSALAESLDLLDQRLI